MLSKVHIQDHRGVPLCNVRTTRSIGIMMEPFQKWRELRQTAQCGKCFARAKKAGLFKPKASEDFSEEEMFRSGGAPMADDVGICEKCNRVDVVEWIPMMGYSQQLCRECARAAHANHEAV